MDVYARVWSCCRLPTLGVDVGHLDRVTQPRCLQQLSRSQNMHRTSELRGKLSTRLMTADTWCSPVMCAECAAWCACTVLTSLSVLGDCEHLCPGRCQYRRWVTLRQDDAKSAPLLPNTGYQLPEAMRPGNDGSILAWAVLRQLTAGDHFSLCHNGM